MGQHFIVPSIRTQTSLEGERDAIIWNKNIQNEDIALYINDTMIVDIQGASSAPGPSPDGEHDAMMICKDSFNPCTMMVRLYTLESMSFYTA